jgi:hypothetical protein
LIFLRGRADRGPILSLAVDQASYGRVPTRLLHNLLDCYNLGVASVAAKGTTQDYLTHSSTIPVQIMALGPVFLRVVKAWMVVSHRFVRWPAIPHLKDPRSVAAPVSHVGGVAALARFGFAPRPD